MSHPPPFDARLIVARSLSPAVRELTFERLDQQPMVFEPGQFVSAVLPGADGARVKRSYSIASCPDGSPRFELAVTRVEGGPASTWLHEMPIETVIRFTGPQGVFTRAATASPPSLLIATGTGVAPMRSFIRAAVASGSTTPIWLLLGVRHEADILYKEELSEWARTSAHGRFEVTLSQPLGDWVGRRGHVQKHVPELFEMLANSAEDSPHAYVCGLDRMVRDVRTLLREQLALPRSSVHGERYD
jgi:NAD(P)H-flavin reductase